MGRLHDDDPRAARLTTTTYVWRQRGAICQVTFGPTGPGRFAVLGATADPPAVRRAETPARHD